MTDFTAAVALVLVGAAVGAIPTYVMDKSRWKRDRLARTDEALQRTLVDVLMAARDVRHFGRLLAEANRTADTANQRTQRQRLESGMDRFQYAYHELSILSDAATYAFARRLDTAVLRLQMLLENGGTPDDPDVEAARQAAQAERRNLRDHIRRARGLDDLGDLGQSPDHRT